MSKFRKKPVVINAWPAAELLRQFLDHTLPDEIAAEQSFRWLGWEDEAIVIRTLEGDMTAAKTDWIIRGVQGEFYPCKPDIFKMTYEPVDV